MVPRACTCLSIGIYFGERQETTDGVAWDTMLYSEDEVARITRVAAEAALKRGGDLLSVDKANVLASSRLWRNTATEVIEKEYPTVNLRHGLVDSVAMDIITRCESWRDGRAGGEIGGRRERQAERERDRERHRETQRDRERQRETERQRQSERQTERQRNVGDM